MQIEIVGHDDPQCRRLERLAREVAAELNLHAKVELTDVDTVPAAFDACTPALVVDGQVKVSGRMPSRNEIGSWLLPRLN